MRSVVLRSSRVSTPLLRRHLSTVACVPSSHFSSLCGSDRRSSFSSQNQCIQKRSIFGFGGSDKKSSISKNSDLHIYLIKDGNKHLNNGHALQAITDYDEALKVEETPEAYAKKAWAYFSIQDYSTAKREIDRSLELNPRCLESLCCAGTIYIATENHFEALKYLNNALELTSPMDFRYQAIQQVINGCKVSMRMETAVKRKTSAELKQSLMMNSELNRKSESINAGLKAAAQGTASGKTVANAPFANEEDRTEEESFNPFKENTENYPRLEDLQMKQASKNDDLKNQQNERISPPSSLGGNSTLESMSNDERNQLLKDSSPPFTSDEFMEVQKDLTEQMINIGGDEFQKKMMKLNEIPAVAKFQAKALSGQQPSYNDYMDLMKDKKFQRYNSVMSDVAKMPQFRGVTEKFAQQDWIGAYEILKSDPEALKLYMKAFEHLDEDTEDEDTVQDGGGSENVIDASVVTEEDSNHSQTVESSSTDNTTIDNQTAGLEKEKTS